jgi:polyisoprenyl-phosphate glycosyltransferase
MDFSVIVPVYNNQHSLRQVHQNITNCFSTFKFQYQILFVDDGSEDQSFATLQQIKAADPHVSILQLKQNYNQSVAMFAGLERAIGKYTIVVSADLQEEEKFIEKLLHSTLNFPDADLIIGYRSKNSDYLIFKILSRLFYKIIQFKIPQMPYGGFDVGIMSFDLKQRFIQQYYEGIFIQAALLNLANKVHSVAYHRKKSAATTFRFKSIFFKLRYFFSCITSVYLPSKKMAPGEKGNIYLVKNHLP